MVPGLHATLSIIKSMLSRFHARIIHGTALESYLHESSIVLEVQLSAIKNAML